MPNANEMGHLRRKILKGFWQPHWAHTVASSVVTRTLPWLNMQSKLAPECSLSKCRTYYSAQTKVKRLNMVKRLNNGIASLCWCGRARCCIYLTSPPKFTPPRLYDIGAICPSSGRRHVAWHTFICQKLHFQLQSVNICQPGQNK
jgi:hypothetical protein